MAKSESKRKRDRAPRESLVSARKDAQGLNDEEKVGSLDDAQLELGQQDEDQDSEQQDDENDPSDSELDPFPEIEGDSSDSDDEEHRGASVGEKPLRSVSFAATNHANDDDSEGGEEDDEEEQDIASEESGDDIEGDYDSDDIDNWDEEDEDRLADEAANRETDESEIEEDLSQMIARASSKPQEDDIKYNKLGLTSNQAAAPVFGKNRNPDGSAKGVFKKSDITGQPKRVYPDIEPEYDSDSSTEDAPNRIGNVPLEWYDDMPHIGYDVEGRKVLRPATGDELDKFLETVEDPSSWMRAQDKSTGKDVQLSSEELDIIRRLQNAEIPDGSYDPYEPAVDWYTGKDKEMQMPLSSRPEPKSRFVPSKWEHKKVMKIVRAIRQGRITPHGPAQSSRPQFYNVWSDTDQPLADHPMNMPAPKMRPPGHAESYNPPPEYLFDEQERKDWEAADPTDRRTSYMPAKYDALRKVPGYQNFVKERFERCLDLYLAPRMRRQRLDIENAHDLLPKLPSPRELRPFPTVTSVLYEHPENVKVRSVSVDPRGLWLVTGADDGCVRLWDLAIARCAATWDLHASSAQKDRSPVFDVEWCVNKNLSLFAACTDGKVAIIVPPQTNGASTSSRGINWTSPSMAFATQGYQPAVATNKEEQNSPAKWIRPTDAERRQGIASIIQVRGVPKRVVWHARGDYFGTVTSSSQGTLSGGSSSQAVLIHQLSKQRTQAPFAKASKGSAVQAILFHPLQPHFFVATQRTIRIYNLATQTLLKTLQSGVRWISSMHLHGPTGNHLLVSSYDRRVAWFDLELSTRPYKTLRYHERAVRAVEFHNRYPLFASVSDDGNAHILHATIYNDLVSSPLIVPLKVLRGHSVKEGLGILNLAWHPTMPWLITAGADGQARMWTP